MRRLFVIIILALLAGVGIVAVIESDPGYVLIAYGAYTVETSLWVGLVVLALLCFAVYAVVRLLRRLLGGQNSLVSWVEGRRNRASSRLTTRGLISYTEGNWDRARRQLISGAKASEAPLLNYLVAARASHQLGEADKVREYLGAAGETDSEARTAVELTTAELQLRSGEYRQALATLEQARRNVRRLPQALDLLRQAYVGLGDWPALAQLLPELKKHKVMPADELQTLEREVYSGLLRAGAVADSEHTGEPLRLAWEQVPAALKQDASLVHDYVDLLIGEGYHSAADKVVRRMLKQHWDSGLVRQYGYVLTDNNARQLAKAESWLPQHSDDPQLMLCLGRLAAREKLWGKAREYFEQTYAIERTPEVCAELGRLLLALGEPRVAGAYYREGLQAQQGDLPALPMPEHANPSVAKRLANSS
ncbi:heme biosynthesis protein HemY [Mangrovimicrobium sediminis]|uniref:Heme biosynthesis protein HemY n=1 Tax=Mangrovimicrobium sediminis TaxID=2562682 RepID=A0A4Z0M361_9GAMM|nr:heme biosynthesis HemY N-terminal domain-containing protein [Haliea sp. SAOS-164]TGD73880.1 heme biosynthesis protein HemY [Haliea sp. SAOS-164]